MIKNPFIEKLVEENGLKKPDIDVFLQPSYAQLYEDIIIESILLSYITNKNNQLQSLDSFCYIDIGGNHPVSTSNTFLFYSKYNMRGIIVEANPLLTNDLTQFRTGDIVICAAVVGDSYKEKTINLFLPNFNEIASTDINFIRSWYEINNIENSNNSTISVSCLNIKDILSMVQKPIAILSIDVEGCDYELLQSIDFNLYRPVIIVIEPSSFYSSNNEEKMTNLLKNNGYSLIAKTPVNCIYQIS